MALAIEFAPHSVSVEAGHGDNLLDLATAAGVHVDAPCGGQGRCGRCKVRLPGGHNGHLQHRSNARLTPAEEHDGFVLCCQTSVRGTHTAGEKSVTVVVPGPRRHMIRSASRAEARLDALPIACDWKAKREWAAKRPIRTMALEIEPPSLGDSTSDFDRLRRELRRQFDLEDVSASLGVVRQLGRALRDGGWKVVVTLEMPDCDHGAHLPPRLLAVEPGQELPTVYGLAVDVGTTGVVAYLVDLTTAQVVDSASAYNAQIACGEDVISRMIYAQRGHGLDRLQELVVGTVNELVDELVERAGVPPRHIYEIVAAGNTVMTHLLLGVDPKYLREEPYVPTISVAPKLVAADLDLNVNPQARLNIMPSIGSYVGGDITAGVVSSGMYATDKLSLLVDIGTNGEIVLGCKDWLISCACSAGPAFEGAGVTHGVRATAGAIEDIWIDDTYEPTFATIDGAPAHGICGSGLIDLVAELFVTGLLEKGGRLRRDVVTPRLREGRHGWEYVVAWEHETVGGHDIVVTDSDIGSLLRAKAAIYAGFSVLCRSVGVELSDVEEILIGGAFGQYINIEKAIRIGLLPDQPLERFKYMGNTSALGAYAALVSVDMSAAVREVAGKMTYLELSADNSFMEEYTSALFLPHTCLEAFPSVQRLLSESDGRCAVASDRRSPQVTLSLA